MVERQADVPTSGPVSAIAAWKAKHKPLSEATNTNYAPHILPTNQDKENNAVAPPAKKQKVEPRVQPSKPKPLKKRHGSRLGPRPLPASERSQSPSQSTGTQESPIDVDLDGAPDKYKASMSYNDTRVPHGEDKLEDRHVSGSGESRIGDSDSGSEIIILSEAPKKQLSDFVPNENNVVGETHNEWTVLLFPKDSLTLVGQYDLWVRKGAVNIAGAVLHVSSRLHRVYAPSTHSLPSIRPIPSPYGPQNLPAEITLISCTSRIRLLKQLSPKFARVWNHKHAFDVSVDPKMVNRWQRSFLFLKSSADDPYKRPLHIIEPPLDWEVMTAKLLSFESPRPVAIMMCGPKSSGKSTFCRILANSMLTRISIRSQSDSALRGCDRVAFLDLDPGQPEFSPPGEISLIQLQSCNFGPPFTHSTPNFINGDQLIRAHHIGAVTPKDDPEHYLRCALDLWNHYRRILRSYPSCPLIVNCSGWIQGSGLEVLQAFIHCMDFTDIVYMSTLGPAEVVESLVEAADRAKTPFHTLSSQPSEFTTRTAADLRIMQALSYFHLDEPEGGNLRWNASPLNEAAPLCVRYAGPSQAIFGIMILGEEQDPEYIMDILAGCAVGLIAIEDDSAISANRSEEGGFDIQSSNGVCNGDEHAVEGVQDSSGAMDVQDNPVFRPRLDIPSEDDDDDSDASSVSNFKDSFRPSTRKPRNHVSNHSKPITKPKPSSTHLQHPSVSRTPEGLPYLAPNTGFTTPLDPSKSQSLGQALIRGIDTQNKTLHLITPIPQSTLQSLHAKNTKIVLVRGKLDAPVWAYREELVAAAARRRRRKDKKGEPERLTPYEVKEWAKGVPWTKAVDDREVKSQGAKVWKVKRHLRTRVSGGEMSD